MNVLDEKSFYKDKEVIIGEDVTIYPNVVLRGNTKIGSHTIIDSNTIIIDSEIGENNYIVSSVIEKNNKIGNFNKIGPFCHLRENNEIGNANTLGSFVEVKNSYIGDDNHCKHLSYIGDVILHNKINIGAGVVFANYNSKKNIKSQSTIFDKSAIGANTTLVSPVVVGENSLIGASSVVSKDISKNSLYFTKRDEIYKEDYYEEDL